MSRPLSATMQALSSISHHPHTLSRFPRLLAPRAYAVRNASTDLPSRPMELEKPDKFRPPSHPQRLNRRPPRQYPGPPLSEPEREAQKTKRYPHTFPNEGTKMHWFLTNKRLHLYISLGTLTFLALISLTQSFLATSPYAHLLPPISSLPFHPIRYVLESVSVIRLHVAYVSEQTYERRQQGMLDAQKRRIYRRAHGMEDLTRDEDQGVDVRGLVPWDDGLTPKEREEGGRVERLTGRQIMEMGGQFPEDFQKRGGQLKVSDIVFPDGMKARPGQVGAGAEVGQELQPVPESKHAHEVESEPAPPKKRKVKRWLGIWE